MSNTESHHSRPPIRRGYPIHLARGVPAFMDPLQYILKDAVAAPRSSPPLSPSSPPASAAASAAVAIDSLAAHTLSSVAAPALRGGSWAQAARIGRVVHESASAGTGGRTIEIDVTPAQLHELLRMRQQSSLKTATTASRDFGSTEQRASRGDYGVGLAMLVAAGLLGSAVLLPPDDASARRQALQPPFTCVL
ncbi:hypothetical protein GGI07_001518 [Coemansia sp. Benny D115]|nr:hypothetical protein GGI07_001518 [Coemansia sp. Benny D115]